MFIIDELLADLHKAANDSQHKEPGYGVFTHSPWHGLILSPTENWYLIFPNLCICTHQKPCCAIPAADIKKKRGSITSFCVGRYEGGLRARWSALKSTHTPASNTRGLLWCIYLQGIQSWNLRCARPAWVTTLSSAGLLLRRLSPAPGRAREAAK